MASITDAQLLAYLAGEASPEIAAEIEGSEVYLQRAHALELIEHKFQARLLRAECPDAHELAEYHLGLLAHSRVVEMRQHILICPYCQDESEQLKTFMKPQPGALERVRSLIASLVPNPGVSGPATGFTTQHSEPAFALRGGQNDLGDQVTHWVFQAEEVQIIIQIQSRPAESVFSLSGLITGLELINGCVEINSLDRPVFISDIDELGNFSFEHLTPGEYQIAIFYPEITIHIPTIHVTGDT